MLGDRYIDTFACSQVELQARLAGGLERGLGDPLDAGDARPAARAAAGGVVLRQAARAAVLADQAAINAFFAPLRVVALQVALNSSGQPSGFGFVQFSSSEDTTAALGRVEGADGTRYVEVFRSTCGEMERRARTRSWWCSRGRRCSTAGCKALVHTRGWRRGGRTGRTPRRAPRADGAGWTGRLAAAGACIHCVPGGLTGLEGRSGGTPPPSAAPPPRSHPRPPSPSAGRAADPRVAPAARRVRRRRRLRAPSPTEARATTPPPPARPTRARARTAATRATRRRAIRRAAGELPGERPGGRAAARQLPAGRAGRFVPGVRAGLRRLRVRRRLRLLGRVRLWGVAPRRVGPPCQPCTVHLDL